MLSMCDNWERTCAPIEGKRKVPTGANNPAAIHIVPTVTTNKPRTKGLGY